MPIPRTLSRLAILALLSFTSLAGLAAPPPAPESPVVQGQTATAKVHDHAAYVFRTSAGPRTPAMRAAEATQTLSAAIDQDIQGTIQVVVHGDLADVKLGDRLLFRLTPDDARLDGAASLADYAPKIQTDLDTFVTKERKRASLQHGVLATSLAVFFAVLLFVLLRAFFRATRSLERRFEEGDAELPPAMRKVMGGDRAQSRAVVLFTLSAARIAVSLGALYVLLLASLSLFEATRPFRDRLALWAASPFRTMASRLVHGLPNLILLIVLLGVLRAGWQAMSVAFTRLSRNEGRRTLKTYQLVPYRLLARVALVTGALLMLPLALGVDMGLFTAVGLLLLAVLGLASLPLLANVGVGVFALVTHQFPVGNWVRVRLPNAAELAGEVTSVDFFHVRLVPEGSGEVRIPHLLALWSAVDHLPNSRALEVELAVPRARLDPRRAHEALLAAAMATAKANRVDGAPSVELLELTPDAARFRVALSEAKESLRSPLLLALAEVGAPVLVEAGKPGPAVTDPALIAERAKTLPPPSERPASLAAAVPLATAASPVVEEKP